MIVKAVVCGKKKNEPKFTDCKVDDLTTVRSLLFYRVCEGKVLK